MLQLLIALTALAIILYAIIQPDPESLKRYARQYLPWIILGAALLLVVAGRAHWLFAAGAGLYALFRRLLPLLPLLLPTLRRLWPGERQIPGRDAGNGESVGKRASAMTVEEARSILGVNEHADKAAIVAAHRRLMQKIHPDRGGSDYLAGRVNEAKRCLLEKR